MKKAVQVWNKIKIIVYALISAVALSSDLKEIPIKYNIQTAALLVILFVFYQNLDGKCKEEAQRKILWLPAVITSFFILVGKSFYADNTLAMVWGSSFRIIWFFLCLTGYSVLFYYIYQIAYIGLEKVEKPRILPGKIVDILWGRWGFLCITGVILLSWLPVIIISFPGGSCVDVTHQIFQAIGEIPFTTLHPLAHTLFIGFFLNMSHLIFGTYVPGIYLQILVQSIILAIVMSLSLRVLSKRVINQGYLFVVLCIYCFAPFYSNFATMTIKDTLFNTWILLYFTLLVVILEEKERLFQIKLLLPMTVSALGIMLFRNNGSLVVGSTGIALSIYLLMRKEIKGKDKIKGILLYAVCPIALYIMINSSLVWILHAETYNGKEMLSIPFQQTARYIRDRGDDISEEEWLIIGKVLENEKEIGFLYDPNISDPVKRQFRDDATFQDVTNYLILWTKLGFRHPKVYMEALLNHCYGWFDVGLRNSVRYEGRNEIFGFSAWMLKSDKILYYWFNLLNRFPLTGILENVGVYVWWMVILTIRLFHKKKGLLKSMIFMVPLYVSLLVCIASPACLQHPRYAFPILFTMPFLTGALLTEQGKENKALEEMK